MSGFNEYGALGRVVVRHARDAFVGPIAFAANGAR